MRSLWRPVSAFLVGFPILCATSIVAQEAKPGQADPNSAESLHRDVDADGVSKLDEIRRHAADSGDDAAKTATRQGYGHIRQGNSTSETDPLGRSHAPYGAEKYGGTLEDWGLRKKLEDRFDHPAWQLNIDLKEPRRIVVTRPDGTAEEYWYVLFRVTNTTVRKKSKTEVTDYDPKNTEGGSDPKAVKVDTTISTDEEGVPVYTTLDVQLEWFTLKTQALPRDIAHSPEDDLRKRLEEELDVEMGKTLSGKADEKNTEKHASILQQRYANSRRTGSDCSDAFVLHAIAEQEQLWEWRNNKREYILWPASAFKRDLSPAHNLDSVWLDGPRCLPREILRFGPNNEVERTMRYPAVFEADSAFAGWFGSGDSLPEGARLVKDEQDAMYGKLTTVRYSNYDVVDRFGRIVRQGHPSYLGARAAGGEIVKAVPEHKVAGNLESLIGQVAKRPAHRIYRAGDRV